jgi:hypothetical protein
MGTGCYSTGYTFSLEAKADVESKDEDWSDVMRDGSTDGSDYSHRVGLGGIKASISSLTPYNTRDLTHICLILAILVIFSRACPAVQGKNIHQSITMY